VKEQFISILRNNRIIVVAVLIVIITVSFILCFRYVIFYPIHQSDETRFVYIDKDDNTDSVNAKVEGGWTFRMLTMAKFHPRSGRYEIQPREPVFEVYRKLKNGNQTPVRFTLPPVRTMEQLASILGNKFMEDSTSFAGVLLDSITIQSFGYTSQTLPALFIPDTYEFYWNISVEGFVNRMIHENERFWEGKRQALADSIGLTRNEVCTLASIIDEETANNDEKPMIAGMYVNRIHKGMLLQADPTVKFALQDFGLRRILHKHLSQMSPYNTYLNAGLPPGPIRIASISGIDAVLNYVRHPYLYMCAKEDFSGTHNFAKSYDEHLRNARRYTRELNKRKIH